MKFILQLIAVLALVFTQACMNVTEVSSIVDDRPSVRFLGPVERLDDARIYVNNAPAGKLSTFLNKSHLALRVSSGTHLISIRQGEDTIFEEKFFLLDGASKTIRVNK